MMVFSRDQRDQAKALLMKSGRILVVPHDNVDPDGLSSALALSMVLRALGKEVTVTCPGDLPPSLSFLPGYGEVRKLQAGQEFVISLHLQEGTEIEKLRYTVEDHRVNIIVTPSRGRLDASCVTLDQGESPYDLIVVVDTADPSLLGAFATEQADLLASVPVLNIDHHVSNTGFGQVQLLDPTAASATEILTHWFLSDPELRGRVTPDVATLLLTGLITDTRSFQNPNTTPRSLEVAGTLLELGARQQEIVQRIYKTKPLSTLRIWGRALKNIQIDSPSRIVWTSVSQEDLREMGAESPETHGIVDELLTTVPDVDCFILFTQLPEGGLKASLRTTAVIDASRLAGLTYGGGGHPRAAGFRVRQVENFALQVLQCVKRLREEMARMREDREPLPAVRPVAPPPAPTVPPSAPPGPKAPATSIDVVREIAGNGRKNERGKSV